MKNLFLLISCTVFITGCLTNGPSSQTPAPVTDTASAESIRTIPSIHQHNMPALPSLPEVSGKAPLPTPVYPEYSNMVRSKNTVRSKSAPVVCKPVPKAKAVAVKPALKAKPKSKPAVKKEAKKPLKKVAKATSKPQKKPVHKAVAKKPVKSKPVRKAKKTVVEKPKPKSSSWR